MQSHVDGFDHALLRRDPAKEGQVTTLPAAERQTARGHPVVDASDPVRIRHGSALAITDGDNRNVRKLLEEWLQLGQVQAAVQRVNEWRGCPSPEGEGQRVQVRMHDVVPPGLPDDAAELGQVQQGLVARGIGLPEGSLNERDKASFGSGIAGRVQGHGCSGHGTTGNLDAAIQLAGSPGSLSLSCGSIC